MSNQSGILEKTKNIVTDPEVKLDEKAPGTPFALVALSYLAILAMTCIAFGFIVWMS